VGDRLGAGHFSEVWKVARQVPGLGVQQLGALKVTKHEANDDVRTLFKAEIGVLAQLASPYIPSYLDSGKDASGDYWLVVSFIEGQSLEQYVETHGSLSQSDWVRLGNQVSSALAEAHSRGIKHLDIKPDNIMRRSNGDFVLVDFGLARGQFERDPAFTNKTYSAPEQFRHEEELTPFADVFSLGATLYYALTGQNPFSKYLGLPFSEAVQNMGPAMSEIDKKYREVLAPMMSGVANQRPSAVELVSNFATFGAARSEATWHPSRIKSWEQLDELIYERMSESPAFTLHLAQPNGTNLVCSFSKASDGVRIVLPPEKDLNRALTPSGRSRLVEIGFSVGKDGHYFLRKPVLADDCPEIVVTAISEGYALSLAELSYRVEV